MEEDIKILEEQLNIYKRHFENYEKEECLTSVYYELKKYAQALENLLTRYKQLEEENKIYKEELKKIDKALNLEEGTAAPYRSDIIESLKKGIESLKEIIDNSVPKSKVKERMEIHKNYKQSYLKEYEKDLKENRDTTIYHDFAVKEQAKIDMCEELLEEEE